MVTPASTWVFGPHRKRKNVKNRDKVVIVNPQETFSDAKADLVIHHKADAFFQALMQALKIKA
jgi:NAD-dependent SIR2 family protein deacetylase